MAETATPMHRCDRRWRGHVCVIAHHPGWADHQCLCGKKWIRDHDFARDPHSGAGNCRCGRPETSCVHRV